VIQPPPHFSSSCILMSAPNSMTTNECFLPIVFFSFSGTFVIFAGVSAFGFLFTVMLVPETKGRSLEEIQASVTNVLH